MTGADPGEATFQAHVELLQVFLSHRNEIVERIQELLNAQRQPDRYRQDAPLLRRHFEDCFYAVTAAGQTQLRGRLKAAHWAAGFKPNVMPGMHNDLIDAGEMMVRGFHLWQRTRWPGRNARSRYAHTLFNAYLVCCLELLIMRVWDEDSDGASSRLSQSQRLLEELWQDSPPGQPVFVRDARWLFALAQSPTTEQLSAYFTVAERIATSLAPEHRIEIDKASVQMAGGHLRSQLRHYILKNGVSLAENGLVLKARSSNALDIALSVQSLVPLLKAYQIAVQGGTRQRRLELADAICQGISADPELFVNRLDLLGAYSMIEHLFITSDDADSGAYTPVGQRHVQLLGEYTELIRQLALPLCADCAQFRPVAGTYSPYGVIYGFSSNLTEHMALKSLQSDPAPPFSVEDVFSAGHVDKLAWVSGWRKLPHIDPQVQRQFDYPQQFAEEIFDRIQTALCRHVAESETNAVVRTGRLIIPTAEDSQQDPKLSQIPEVPSRYIFSSDPQIVSKHKAQSEDEPALLHDRQEGTFLVSYRTSGGWVAITKDLLTDVLGTGRDVKVVGLPGAAAARLKLMCLGLS